VKVLVSFWLGGLVLPLLLLLLLLLLSTATTTVINFPPDTGIETNAQGPQSRQIQSLGDSVAAYNGEI
jgi:hypothetical protein